VTRGGSEPDRRSALAPRGAQLTMRRRSANRQAKRSRGSWAASTRSTCAR
jgi:hypothetical protein